MTTPSTAPTNLVGRAVRPAATGDYLTWDEFERRYGAAPRVIEG